MTFPRLGLINKNQKGFTLVELMIAIAISSVITGGITMTIFQVIIGSARTNNHMIAVRQAQNAGYWVSHDGQMAQSINIGSDPLGGGFPLVLTWTDWEGNRYKVTYTIIVAPPQLERSLSINDGEPTNTIVAQYIVPGEPKTKCELTGGGTFTLPDTNDAFTITGGPVADSGTITVTAGSISVTTTGSASYNATTGAWTTPATSGTVVVRASGASTAGIWTSATASATVAITADTNGNAIITGRVFIFTVTASVGEGLQRESETRIYEIVPRPG
jgi:prepilin-type N-terminal cleavage/methylation domain-containing protein